MDKKIDEGKLLALVEKALEFEEDARQGFIESQTQDSPQLRARALNMLTSIKQDDDSKLLTGEGLSSLLHMAKPKRIGNYKIVDEFGRGGMGVVYRAEPNRSRF